MRGVAWFVALTAVAAGLGSTARADSVTLTPVQDSTLIEHPTGDAGGGASWGIFAGKTNTASIRRGILQFDLSSIPAGSTITRVDLTLTVTMTRAGATNVQLRRALASWGEALSSAESESGRGGPSQPGDVTWMHRFYNAVPWTSAGGDFASVASGSKSVSGVGSYTWASTAAMVSDAQGWLDNPGANFGWVVLGDESRSTTTKRFASREYPTEASRPHLVVEFTPVPAGARRRR
jgi:hypothetical protein